MLKYVWYLLASINTENSNVKNLLIIFSVQNYNFAVYKIWMVFHGKQIVLLNKGEINTQKLIADRQI